MPVSTKVEARNNSSRLKRELLRVPDLQEQCKAVCEKSLLECIMDCNSDANCMSQCNRDESNCKEGINSFLNVYKLKFLNLSLAFYFRLSMRS